MKAENEQELLTGLKIMRSHLDILIENLENKTKYNNKIINKLIKIIITIFLTLFFLFSIPTTPYLSQ